MLVVDASVAIKWFVNEADSGLALALVGRRLAAPELLLPEVANALWVTCRRGDVPVDDAIVALGHLARGPIARFPVAPLAQAAFALARILDHPAYDCFYLALAEREAAPLVTADQRFLSRVRSARPSARVIRLGDPVP